MTQFDSWVRADKECEGGVRSGVPHEVGLVVDLDDDYDDDDHDHGDDHYHHNHHCCRHHNHHIRSGVLHKMGFVLNLC